MDEVTSACPRMSDQHAHGGGEGRDVLGFRVSGTVSNMSVSMFAWMAQFADVSLRAVTSTE